MSEIIVLLHVFQEVGFFIAYGSWSLQENGNENWIIYGSEELFCPVITSPEVF